MNRISPSRVDRQDAASPMRKAAAIVVGVIACALVFALVDFAVGKFAVSHFPAPEQALVWTRIGHFVAAVLALAAGAEAAWWVWRSR